MDLEAELTAACPPAQLFGWVRDLDRYPEWLDIVSLAAPAPADPSDDGPAWNVDLRAQMGPLARSKRIRMVRTALQEGDDTSLRSACFARRELDGRDHAPWTLEADVEPVDDDPSRSRLAMRLRYGGSLWAPMLDRILRGEIDRSRERLRRLVSGSGGS